MNELDRATMNRIIFEQNITPSERADQDNEYAIPIISKTNSIEKTKKSRFKVNLNSDIKMKKIIQNDQLSSISQLTSFRR